MRLFRVVAADPDDSVYWTGASAVSSGEPVEAVTAAPSHEEPAPAAPAEANAPESKSTDPVPEKEREKKTKPPVSGSLDSPVDEEEADTCAPVQATSPVDQPVSTDARAPAGSKTSSRKSNRAETLQSAKSVKKPTKERKEKKERKKEASTPDKPEEQTSTLPSPPAPEVVKRPTGPE